MPGINGLSHIDGQDVSEWDSRSKRFGATLRSVLFKGLPDVVNEHLHGWHEKLVLSWIEEKEDLRVLDVGCGYGRLSLPIIKKFPDVDITGLDISENYVKLYKDHTHHPAFVAAIANMPAQLGTFDYIICVTVLMYLDDEKLEKAISQLFFHLKPKGKLILIEPHRSGILFQTGFGMLILIRNIMKRDNHGVRSRYFTSRELESYFQNLKGNVLSERRLPVTCLFFLPIVLVGQVLPYSITRNIYRVVSLFDTWLGRFRFPSIYAAYLVMRS